MNPNDRSGERNTGPERVEDSTRGTQLDRFFDGDLSREETAAMLARLRSDPARMRRFGATQGLVDRLREPIEYPDLTDRILCEAETRGAFQRRPFWSRQARAGGLGFAAALAMVGGAWVLFGVLGGDGDLGDAGPDRAAGRDAGPALPMTDKDGLLLHPDLAWEPDVRIDKDLAGQDLVPRLTLEDADSPLWLRVPPADHVHDGAGQVPPGRLLTPGDVDRWRIGPTERAFLKPSRDRDERDKEDSGAR